MGQLSPARAHWGLRFNRRNAKMRHRLSSVLPDTGKKSADVGSGWVCHPEKSDRCCVLPIHSNGLSFYVPYALTILCFYDTLAYRLGSSTINKPSNEAMFNENSYYSRFRFRFHHQFSICCIWLLYSSTCLIFYSMVNSVFCLDVSP